jgi:hypothetical protein
VAVKKLKKSVSESPCDTGPLELDYEEVQLRGLKYYHQNPRVGNLEKVAESLRSNSQFKPIVVNRGTKTGRENEILAGNHTAKAAKSLGWKKIKVAWVDVDDDHARRIVLADNGSTDDATYDPGLLAQLLEDQKKQTGHLIGTTYSDDVLGKLLVEMNRNPIDSIDSIEEAPSDLDGVEDLSRYVLFESDKNYGIPELRLDRIPDRLPEKLDMWGGVEIDGDRVPDKDQWWVSQWHTGNRGIPFERAILSLYTEDFHFEGLYTDPAENTKKIMNCGITTCIMPNYSVNQGWPPALWIWSAYRSAYVARYWQEAGFLVIPDIQYGGSDEALELCLECIPEGAPLVATQIQTIRGDQDRIRTTARLLKKAEEKIGFGQILVYGHTDADEVVKRAGLDAEVVRVETRTNRRRELLDSGTTVKGQRQTRSKKRTRGFEEDGD